MNKHIFSLQKFLTLPVIGIIRGLTLEETLGILPYYVKAGFTTVEITMNTPTVLYLTRTATCMLPSMLPGWASVMDWANGMAGC